MRYENVEEALRLGCKVRGFRSDKGLVTMVIEKHGVCIRAAGGRIDAIRAAASPLYLWLEKGNTFECRLENGVVIMEAKGTVAVRPPEEVKAKARATREPVIWERNGFVYKTTFGRVIDDGCAPYEDYATGVVNVVEALSRVDGVSDLLREDVVLIGRGPSVAEAAAQVIPQLGGSPC
jgi:hypothetical protein